MNYDILIRPLPEDEGGGYVGYVPDLQGCMSDGDTPAEALSNTIEAMDEWITLHREIGRVIPEAGVSLKKAKKRDQALINAIHVLTEQNGALEDHVEEIEKAMSELLDMFRNETGWTVPLSSVLLKDEHCEA